ncbi:hypothetical protein [Bifidobacterium longum]|uniref:hypothetical protein n=1 Tax=Bifidobacterium longum TaxID=216816 RepID=UPI00019CBA82|nr:hypothetical protein [Bifidobacterium longum]EEI80285.1 hypothetical protein HMPREF0175_1550 [Bifidobacterium longum subsp. longum ATCC 55813]
MPSGIAESELVMLRVSGIGKQTDAMARTREDLASLRAIPGVSNVTIINQTPPSATVPPAAASRA